MSIHTPSLFDDHEPPPHTSHTIPKAPDPPSPFDRGMDGSRRAARKWTADEAAKVDQAIETIARRKITFTSDAIWLELGADFPVTKGLASRLTVAKNRGLIENTGRMTKAKRGGDHDHAQRLSVWRSLVIGQDQEAAS